jgi:ethanolamine utilization protein EutA
MHLVPPCHGRELGFAKQALFAPCIAADGLDVTAGNAIRRIGPEFRTTGVTQLHDTGDDHFHGDDDYALDYDPHFDGRWLSDNVDLVSVGIDVGSSGTQVVFSRIRMSRMDDSLSSRYVVVSREQLYQSPVAFTPYGKGSLIDTEALAAIVDEAYGRAGFTPETIDTGAVILTGEALRRENAFGIADVLAAAGGDFVCTMAGHHIEAQLAAYGSGAAWMSQQNGSRILNIDIGGGTTKYALIERGRVVETAAIHVGGRLHVFGEQERLVRLEPAGQSLAARAGLAWSLDAPTTALEREALASLMADTIVAGATGTAPADTVLTDALPDLTSIAGVMFSGGVSEFVYGRETRDFGDMGRLVGTRLARMAATGHLPWPVLPAGTGIRATALGLSEYSVQLSGNTIFVSDPDRLLPRRNLRVIRPDIALPEAIETEKVAEAITAHLARYRTEGETPAYAFHWDGTPSHARISAFARGLAMALAEDARNAQPIYIVLDGDIARTLGHLLRDELHVASPLMIVDGIALSDFEYIDFGRIRRPSNTVPVTIKSLLFSKDPRASGIRQRK